MKLFDAANQYCRESDWKTIAAIKFCLVSIGIAVGMLLPQSMKGYMMVICVLVFAVTYIPLMRKFYKIWKKM